jgi:HlyD family secretion protein
VTIDGQIPEVRPGFTCTADITTADRANAVSVPIQALTVRELTFDPQGKVVKAPKPEKGRKPATIAVEAAELKPGYTKKETEGVFVVDKENKAQFVQVKTGIAGDKFFEVIAGLKVGDRVITGPFASVRTLNDGGPVKVEDAKK